MVKLADVAKHAGVGVGTASRALTGRGYVEAGTRERVLASARALDYTPDATARALRERRTGVVGLVLPDLHNEFYTASATVLQHELDTAGLQLLVASTGNDGAREESVLATMLERRVDGLIHVPTAVTQPRLPLPVVQLNRATADRSADVSVVSDDRSGIEELARLVLRAGHRDLAVIGGPQELSTSQDRLAGFRDALGGIEHREIEVPFSVDGGRTAMTELLHDLPSAVLVLSSRILMGVLDVCGHERVDIPGELSVAAFGGPDWYDVWQPGITAFEPPLAEMGRRAAHEIVALLRGDAAEATGGLLRIRGQVVRRRSVLDRSVVATPSRTAGAER